MSHKASSRCRKLRSERPRVGHGDDLAAAAGHAARGRRRRGWRRWCGRRRRAAPARAAGRGPRSSSRPGRRRWLREAPTCRAAAVAAAQARLLGQAEPRGERRGQRGGRVEAAPSPPPPAAPAPGTSAPARRSCGQIGGDVRRHEVRERQRAAELQRADQLAGHALVGQRRPRAAKAARAAGQPPRRCRGSPQRSQRARREPGQRPHARRAQPQVRARQSRAAGDARGRHDDGEQLGEDAHDPHHRPTALRGQDPSAPI